MARAEAPSTSEERSPCCTRGRVRQSHSLHYGVHFLLPLIILFFHLSDLCYALYIPMYFKGSPGSSTRLRATDADAGEEIEAAPVPDTCATRAGLRSDGGVSSPDPCLWPAAEAVGASFGALDKLGAACPEVRSTVVEMRDCPGSLAALWTT